MLAKTSYIETLEAAWRLHLAPRTKDAPTVISTFAGCGGSSLGYSMAGFRELLAVEWDNNAVETFKVNFPDVPVYHGDICALSVDKALRLSNLEVGELDVLDGSPPCQGFSTAGKRKMSDSRNQLFTEYVRLIRGLQPRVFVMENVSGMVKGKMKLLFAEILRELKATGYRVSARLMNTIYFNVPQTRQRIIFVGVRDGHCTFPRPINKIIGCLRLDDREAQYSVKRYGDKLVTEGEPLRTIVGLNRLFWDREHELGPKSYAINSSFPSAFRFAGDWMQIKKRVANSVPPLFMKAIAEHVRAELLKKVDKAAAA